MRSKKLAALLATLASISLMASACGRSNDATPKTKNDALTGSGAGAPLTRPSATGPVTTMDSRANCKLKVDGTVLTSCVGFVNLSWSVEYADGGGKTVRSINEPYDHFAPSRTSFDFAPWVNGSQVVAIRGALFLESSVYADFNIPFGENAPLCPFVIDAIVRTGYRDIDVISPPSAKGQVTVEECDENLAREARTNTTTTEPSTTTSTTSSTTSSTTTTTTLPKPTTTPAPSTSTPSTMASTTSSIAISTTTTNTAPKTCVLLLNQGKLTICKKVLISNHEWRAAGKRIGVPVSLTGSGWVSVGGLPTLNLAIRPIPVGATSLVIQAVFTDGTRLPNTEIKFSATAMTVAVGYID